MARFRVVRYFSVHFMLKTFADRTYFSICRGPLLTPVSRPESAPIPNHISSSLASPAENSRPDQTSRPVPGAPAVSPVPPTTLSSSQTTEPSSLERNALPTKALDAPLSNAETAFISVDENHPRTNSNIVVPRAKIPSGDPNLSQEVMRHLDMLEAHWESQHACMTALDAEVNLFRGRVAERDHTVVALNSRNGALEDSIREKTQRLENVQRQLKRTREGLLLLAQGDVGDGEDKGDMEPGQGSKRRRIEAGA
ncbi:hypothetical protein PLICRDRAFT_122785 [Plicaturopsis crispa FD-325 SS-3]|nr:hypothetical protein PLICRDRAFT_122785 [Plicaturopsis crispa FD-325 SS-3]